MALATDYDGTLAHDGVVAPDTLDALRRLKESGRRLILVTGRELPDLLRAFPELGCCDLIVAENGGLLYEPATGREKVLAPEPPEAFVERLREREVQPLSVGRSIVASWEPMQDIVLETIRELGLELQIVFNKGAVMVLPSGVTKASGLAAALLECGLSPHNVVAAGDAENDHGFLAMCGCSAAVANAIETIKAEVDLVTRGARGEGVRELIDQLLGSDLADVVRASKRHRIPIDAEQGDGFFLRPNGGGLLVAGISGGGKSTLVTGILERLTDRGFQFCVIDPEGDYLDLENAVVLGDARQRPRAEEVLEILRRPSDNVVVNMLDIDLADRPAFFNGLLTRLSQLRAQTGRPHWIVLDEAHHLVPASRPAAAVTLPRELSGAILVTVHPDQLAPDVLSTVDTVAAVGGAPATTIRQFCAGLGETPPDLPSDDRIEAGQALLWDRSSGRGPVQVEVVQPRSQRRRHARKYSEGELGEAISFYFRGPDGALALRAQNLSLFLQIAAGVDDRTWLHHLRAGDYSAWVRDVIKDGDLAEEFAAVESDPELSAQASRARIKEAVDRRYTGPASENPGLA